MSETTTTTRQALNSFPAGAVQFAAFCAEKLISEGKAPLSRNQLRHHLGLEVAKIEYPHNLDGFELRVESPFYTAYAVLQYTKPDMFFDEEKSPESFFVWGTTVGGYHYEITRAGFVRVQTFEVGYMDPVDLGSRTFVPQVYEWAQRNGFACSPSIMATMQNVWAEESPTET